MGALVTLDLPDGSPIRGLPWIITFGPLDDSEDWEPVVSGPYERAHALALAEAVVADDDLMAMVEPVLPHLSADEIRGEIAASRLAEQTEVVPAEEIASGPVPETPLDESGLTGSDLTGSGLTESGLTEPPDEEAIRAGFVRIAASLVRR